MSKIHFTAKPFIIRNRTILLLPKPASAELPSRGQVMVIGTINSCPLQTALEPDGAGSHWFEIDEQLQTVAHARAGDTVALEIESTKDWPEPRVPADIQAALDANPRMKDLWLDVTPMARWEWIRWINATENLQTRAHRIEVTRSKLFSGLRRPCCFNRNMCCVPEVSKSGVLLGSD